MCFCILGTINFVGRTIKFFFSVMPAANIKIESMVDLRLF